MENNMRIKKERKGMVLSQIIILVLGTIAIAYALGENFGVVSAGAVCTGAGGTCKISGTCSGTEESADCPSGEACCIPLATGPNCIASGGTCKIEGTTCSGTTYQADCVSPYVCCRASAQPPQDVDASIAAAAAAIANKQPTSTPTPVNLADRIAKETIRDASGATHYTPSYWEQTTPFLGAPEFPLWAANLLTGIYQIGVNWGIATGLYFGIKQVLSFIPIIDPGLADTIATWSFWGYGIGSTIALIPTLWGGNAILGSIAVPFLGAVPWLGIIGGVGGAIFSLFAYRKEMQEVYVFKCYSWVPEKGGISCNQCGQNGLPCTKYQCQSLGQQCEFLNEGTDNELCTKVDRYAIAPEITPWKEALLEDYAYNPSTVTAPDKGVSVNYAKSTDKCIDYYKPISFGVALDQPSQCKYSLDKRYDSYEKMPDLFLPSTNGLKAFNHSITLSMSDISAAEGATPVSNSGEHNVFVRCQNPAGVANAGNFVFKFCISQQPRITPPIIEYTSPLNNMPIKNGLTEIAFSAYTDEPAYCRWSRTDTDYESMTNTMSSTTTANSIMLYKSTGTLTGLTSGTNTFYIRCKDLFGNANPTSYVYKLEGTQALVIDSVGPSDVVKGSSTAVKVTLTARTSSGANEGGAICGYNRGCWINTGSMTSYTPFKYPDNTEAFSAYQHSQDLFIRAGTYTCSIQCMDIGGNTDTKTTTYTVEVDEDSPVIARAYNQDNLLKLVTNEKAECVYDILNCNYNFGDGTAMTDSEDGLSHTTSWNTRNNLYVKCKDDYDNQPVSGECSMVVRAINVV